MESGAGEGYLPEKVSLKPRKNDPNLKSAPATVNPNPDPKKPSHRGKTNTGEKTELSPDKKKKVDAVDEPHAQIADGGPKPPQATAPSTMAEPRPVLSLLLDKLDELSLDIRSLRDQLQDQQSQLDAHDNKLMALADQIDEQQSRLEAHDIQLREQDVQLSDPERDIESLGGLVMRLDDA